MEHYLAGPSGQGGSKAKHYISHHQSGPAQQSCGGQQTTPTTAHPSRLTYKHFEVDMYYCIIYILYYYLS